METNTARKPIYLDYNATTPLTAEVIAAMLPYLEEHFGNPSSSHPYGRTAQRAVEVARSQVASLIGASPDEIIFTSGGTESNNLAIRGITQTKTQKGRHIITSAIEHPAVTEVCQFLGTQGFDMTILPVDSFGVVAPAALKAALQPDTILVSIMHANNEVGTIQPIKTLAALTHEAGALFHTDAAQTLGKIPVNVNDLEIDLLSIAGHKVYAPKGIGALYIKRGLRLENILFGAGQEQGLRPGTENVLGIVGLGAAAEQAAEDLDHNQAIYRQLRDRLHNGLTHALPKGTFQLNGHPELRLPNTLNLSFHNLEANRILSQIQDAVAASAGAACHSGDVQISQVLQALGIPPDWAKGTLRFSVGRMTTAEEIDRAVEIISKAIINFLKQ